MVNNTLLAAGLIMLAMADIALIDNWVRYLTPEIGLWQFHFMRSVLVCGILAGLAAAMGWRLRPHRFAAVAWRSALASLGMVLYFGALSLMTISQAGAGLFTAPIFVLVISVLFFGVRVGVVRILAVGLGFVGVMVLLRPWGDAMAISASVIAVAAGFFHAFGAVLTRQWCEREGTAALNFGYFFAMGGWGLLGVLVLLVLPVQAPEGPAGWFTRGWVVPSAAALFWTALQGFGGMIAIGLLIRGYQLAEASRITVFEYAFLPFAAFWAFLLFAELPDMATVVGTLLIVSAGMLIAFRGGDRPPADPGAEMPPTPPGSTQP
jgi:drug/metabolite transporter (DMT)-like permease